MLAVDDPTPNTSRTADLNLMAILPDINIIRNDLLKLDPSKCGATFRTFPSSGKTADFLSFLLGSCRYPGLLVEDQGGRPDLRADGSSISPTATDSVRPAAFTHDGAATRSTPTC